MNSIKAGWGESNILPTGGKIYIAGCVPFRATDVVHDDIKATALVLESEEKRIIWVSCDFCHPSKQVEDKLIEIMHKRLPNFKADELILSSTHATACFYLSDNEILNSAHLLGEGENVIPFDVAREQFCLKISDAVVDAVNNMSYCDMEYASMDITTGLCRRVVYKDGTAQMYGNVHRDDFMKMEYEDGTDTKAIYFYEKGTRNLTGVLIAAPCPAQYDEGSTYITADFWGYTRNLIKEKFGQKTKVLPLCRAAGELSLHDLFAENSDNEWCQSAAQRLGEYIGKNAILFERNEELKASVNAACFDFVTENITFPAREIGDEQYIWAKSYLNNGSNYDKNGKADDWETDSLARHLVKFKENSIKSYDAKVSVVKLGDIVFFTAPAELFSEYSKRIISKFPQYAIFDIQLTHDSIGYLPTKEAIMHGGYSTDYFSAFTDDVGGALYIECVSDLILRLAN